MLAYGMGGRRGVVCTNVARCLLWLELVQILSALVTSATNVEPKQITKNYQAVRNPQRANLTSRDF